MLSFAAPRKCASFHAVISIVRVEAKCVGLGLKIKGPLFRELTAFGCRGAGTNDVAGACSLSSCREVFRSLLLLLVLAFAFSGIE